MIFNSFSFICICLIPSIVAVLIVDKMGGQYKIRVENLILLLFSLLFFAWSGLSYLKILLLLIVLNYMAGMLKEKIRGISSPWDFIYYF